MLKRKIMCFENGLPRQSADWLAMTGFFDSLSSLYTREPFIQCNTEDFLSV